MPLRLLGRAQRPDALGLAVDELQGAQHLALRCAHRHHEHRLRAITGMLVEPAIDLERRAGWRLVGVGQVDDRPREGDVTGDALAVERQRRRAEGDLDALVLGEREAQTGRAVGRLFHEIERAGVAAGDLPRLGQDRLQQDVEVALGRELDPDGVQLAELALQAGALGRSVEIGERVGHRARQERPGGAGRHQAVPSRRPRSGGGGIDDADEPGPFGGGRRATGAGQHDALGTAVDRPRLDVVLVRECCRGRGGRRRAGVE